MKKRILSSLLSLIMVFSMFTSLLSVSESKVSAATQNQLNMVARADYMYGLTWVCQQYTEGWRGNFYAGNTYHVPYGQPIYSGQYIGFHGNTFDSDGDTIAAFLEAANTPGSLFYTGRSYYTGTTAPYYVSDCSAFVSWCWGIKRTTTYYIPGVTTKIGATTVHHATWSLQLGDALNHPEHVIMVTGLEYDASGAITQIEITEQTPPQLKRSYYTPQQLYNKYYEYTIYRYYGDVPMAPNQVVDEWESDDIGMKYKYANGTYASGWTKINGEDYFFGGGNYMYTGWLDYEGKRYIFNPLNGIMQRGWFKVDGVWYYFDSNGVMQTGWIQPESGGAWYYLNSDGSMATGWIMDGETTYYLNPDSGAMATGWTSIDGVYHEFSPWGVYYHDTAVDLGDNFTAVITTNSDPDKALSLSGNNVVIRTRENEEDQIWNFEKQTDGSYKIINKSTSWLMDVQDASTSIGANVQTWKDNGATAQRWILTLDDGCEGYSLRPVNAMKQGRVMDVLNAETADGTNVVLSNPNGGTNQQFTVNFYKADLIGDADKDGELSIADVTYIQEFVAGIITDTKKNVLADVNGNEKIDIRDATYIQMHLAEVIEKFPCES